MLKKLYHFLGSLRLAIVCLVSVTLLLIVATVVEGQYGTKTANLYIYKAPWFDCVLSLVFINILFATIHRYPFKKHQIGFVMTHIGILLILIGSMITRQWGLEGMLNLLEGEKSNTIVQEGTVLLVENPRHPALLVDTDRYEGRTPKFSLGEYAVQIEAISPHSETSFTYETASTGILGQTAIQFSLKGSMASISEWLSTYNPQLSKPDVTEIGLASVHLKVLNSAQELAPSLENTEKTGSLRVSREGTTLVIPLQELQQKPYLLENGTKLSWIEYYPNATVIDNALANDPKEAIINPALRFSVENSDKTSSVFLRFQNIPEFKSSKEGKSSYEFLLEGCQPKLKKSRLDLFLLDGKVYYRSIAKSATITGQIEIGQSFSPGWMDFQFTLLQKIDNARPKKILNFLPKPPQASSIRPAVRLHLIRGEEKSPPIVLQYGEEFNYPWNKEEFRLSYGASVLHLPFSIQLKDFRKIDYPGTNRAQSYESDVLVEDPTHPELAGKLTTIKMNHILVHQDWKFYQADFEILDDGREISRLQVSYDPGTPLIYFGSILMTMGILLMFWLYPARTRELPEAA